MRRIPNAHNQIKLGFVSSADDSLFNCFIEI